MELSKSIGWSSVRHLATLYAGAKITTGTPVEQLVSAALILVVLIGSVIEKVKVKRVIDGYEITIQERKEKAYAQEESGV